MDVKKELDLISEIEEITRNLTFDLHNYRAVSVNIKDCLWFRQFLYGKSYIFLFYEIADFNAVTTTTTCD
jgi:hypothetical protein